MEIVLGVGGGIAAYKAALLLRLRGGSDDDDLAGATVFLCSDASAYVTGQTLHVNGGMAMFA